MIQSELEVYKVYINSDMSFCFALSPVPDYVKATVETVLKIHETEDDGDVLVFLTGQVSGCMSHRLYILTPTLCLLFYTCIGNFSSFSSFPSMFFFPRKRWRKLFPFCKTKRGLCHDTAWRNTSEFCPCTLVCPTLTRWRSLRGRPPLFAR